MLYVSLVLYISSGKLLQEAKSICLGFFSTVTNGSVSFRLAVLISDAILRFKLPEKLVTD